ncbi:MAG: hypothetical protein OXG72_09040, partial [Acidobacteria bacterium]|nr:hypothetical protein [Acidobacteriota bacterium]
LFDAPPWGQIVANARITVYPLRGPTAVSAGNAVWANGESVFVIQPTTRSSFAPLMFRYNQADGTLESPADGVPLTGIADSRSVRGMWSDGSLMYVLATVKDISQTSNNPYRIFAYGLSDFKRRGRGGAIFDGTDDFELGQGVHPLDIWTDASTMYVLDNNLDDFNYRTGVRAYDYSTKAARPSDNIEMHDVVGAI